jgi:hypothetical protein
VRGVDDVRKHGLPGCGQIVVPAHPRKLPVVTVDLRSSEPCDRPGGHAPDYVPTTDSPSAPPMNGPGVRPRDAPPAQQSLVPLPSDRATHVVEVGMPSAATGQSTDAAQIRHRQRVGAENPVISSDLQILV